MNKGFLGFAAGLAVFVLFWAGLQGGYYRVAPLLPGRERKVLRDAPNADKALEGVKTSAQAMGSQAANEKRSEQSRKMLKESEASRKFREQTAAEVGLPAAATWIQIRDKMRESAVKDLKQRNVAIKDNASVPEVYEVWRKAGSGKSGVDAAAGEGEADDPSAPSCPRTGQKTGGTDPVKQAYAEGKAFEAFATDTTGEKPAAGQKAIEPKAQKGYRPFPTPKSGTTPKDENGNPVKAQAAKPGIPPMFEKGKRPAIKVPSPSESGIPPMIEQ
ncbi:MAG: hypothetical protein PHF00_11975 [Elusimicrobia bacterium]|nr:hypothetical protein [Elusimicrobiota bacterium]